jgi:hypothetical protein
MLDKVQENYPVVVEELVPNLLTVGEIQKVLANLLREGISIRNLVTILEALADEARENRDPDYLTAKVRQRLAPQITAQFQDQAGNIRALVVEPNTQSQLEAAANGELALEPQAAPCPACPEGNREAACAFIQRTDRRCQCVFSGDGDSKCRLKNSWPRAWPKPWPR